MHPVGKALWYIEAHLSEKLTVGRLAGVAEVSGYHLVRSFGTITGLPLMRYVRYRRLSKAAVELTASDLRILEIAMNAGYNSHEAFTRAFVACFGVSPETLRNANNLQDLKLVEPTIMNDMPLKKLPEPCMVTSKPLIIAGLRKQYSSETAAGIPNQWEQFAPYIGIIPNQVGNAAFGVKYNGDDEGNVDYLSGVEISRVSNLPSELEVLRLPSQRYAVFDHEGHVSDIRRTWHTIFRDWMPSQNMEIKEAPDFERYTERFNPQTGIGGIEIWVPVAG